MSVKINRIGKQRREMLDKLRLHRRVGLEIEGYTDEDPQRFLREIPHCQIKRDASLDNWQWMRTDRPFGVEVVTAPLNDLKPIHEVFDSITSRGWGSVGNAGLHIHVDVRDFSAQDKLRAVQFANKIEEVMFLLVKKTRYDNRYCRKLPPQWSNIMSLSRYGERIYQQDTIIRYATKYSWLNVFSTRYPTIEFRIFHSIDSSRDGVQFAYLCHNFIELVKNSTVGQLDFIARSVNEEPEARGKVDKLLEALNIPFRLPILNRGLEKEINRRTEAMQYTETVANIVAAT